MSEGMYPEIGTTVGAVVVGYNESNCREVYLSARGGEMAVNPIDTQIPAPSTKLDRYRQAIVQFLDRSVGQSGDRESIETQQIFDLQSDRYLILNLGWRGQERVYNVLIHLVFKMERFGFNATKLKVKLKQN